MLDLSQQPVSWKQTSPLSNYATQVCSEQRRVQLRRLAGLEIPDTTL